MATKSTSKNTPKKESKNKPEPEIKKSSIKKIDNKIDKKKTNSKLVIKKTKSRRKPLKAEAYKMQSFKDAWKEGASTLLDRGRQRGFVTYNEILHLIPDIEKDIESLEILYEELGNHSIRIQDNVELLSVSTDKQQKDAEKEVELNSLPFD